MLTKNKGDPDPDQPVREKLGEEHLGPGYKENTETVLWSCNSEQGCPYDEILPERIRNINISCEINHWATIIIHKWQEFSWCRKLAQYFLEDNSSLSISNLNIQSLGSASIPLRNLSKEIFPLLDVCKEMCIKMFNVDKTCTLRHFTCEILLVIPFWDTCIHEMTWFKIPSNLVKEPRPDIFVSMLIYTTKHKSLEVKSCSSVTAHFQTCHKAQYIMCAKVLFAKWVHALPGMDQI